MKIPTTTREGNKETTSQQKKGENEDPHNYKEGNKETTSQQMKGECENTNSGIRLNFFNFLTTLTS